MAELAFLAFLTCSRFKELAEHGLRVDAERHFLNLNRFKEISNFLFRSLCSSLFLRTRLLLGFFPLLFWRLVGFGLCLELRNLFGGSTAFLILHSKRFVFDGGFRLLRLVSPCLFGRHTGR